LYSDPRLARFQLKRVAGIVTQDTIITNQNLIILISVDISIKAQANMYALGRPKVNSIYYLTFKSTQNNDLLISPKQKTPF
jgi:hypothetical protein